MIIDGHIILNKSEGELTAYDKFLHSTGANNGYSSSYEILKDMDRDGVDFAIMMQGANDLRMEFFKQHPDRLATFINVSIYEMKIDRKKTLSKARELINQGGLGFGQIELYRYGFNVDDPEFLSLVDLSIELSVPLHLESSITIGDYEPGKISFPLYDFELLARKFPDLKLILPSWGGGLCLFEMMPELPDTLRNTYYDSTCLTEGFDNQTMLRNATKVTSQHKMIFGSGSPHCRRFIQTIEASDIPKEVLSGFLGRNLSILLNNPLVKKGIDY